MHEVSNPILHQNMKQVKDFVAYALLSWSVSLGRSESDVIIPFSFNSKLQKGMSQNSRNERLHDDRQTRIETKDHFTKKAAL